MKKIIFVLGIALYCTPNYAMTCGGTKVYTSCNAGYYLSGKNCVACAIGTYKSTSGSGTSCTFCPSSGGVSGTTATTGSTSITDCYLPSGTSFSDDTGSGEYSGNCYYQQ